MARPSVIFVVPAFNEEKTIKSVVQNLVVNGEVVVVDDGSNDRTATIAKDLGASVVQHPINTGYDPALNSGFARAVSLGADVIITFDADGQHPYFVIKAFLEEIEKGADVVVGIRDKKARISEIVFSWISSKLWGLEDPFCGVKAYRKKVYQSLGHFDSYGSIGTELCLFAAKNNFVISQVNFNVDKRTDSPRFGGALIANLRLCRAMILGFLKH